MPWVMVNTVCQTCADEVRHTSMAAMGSIDACSRLSGRRRGRCRSADRSEEPKAVAVKWAEGEIYGIRSCLIYGLPALTPL